MKKTLSSCEKHNVHASFPVLHSLAILFAQSCDCMIATFRNSVKRVVHSFICLCFQVLFWPRYIINSSSRIRSCVYQPQVGLHSPLALGARSSPQLSPFAFPGCQINAIKGTARCAGLLIAPAEGFGPGPSGNNRAFHAVCDF